MTGVRVQIPAPLRALAGGSEEVEVIASDVAGLIDALDNLHRGFRERLCDPSGSLRSYVRLFVNDEDVRHLQDQRTPLKSGDVVAIVPAIAGGASGVVAPRCHGRLAVTVRSAGATGVGPALSRRTGVS